MKKSNPSNSNVHSFLGRGVIEVEPERLWQHVKTPSTRRVYDTMVKTCDTLREIDERRKIVYLRHEVRPIFYFTNFSKWLKWSQILLNWGTEERDYFCTYR